jgi:modulator of FtsH protease HflC
MKLSLAGGAIAVLLLLAAIVGYSTLFTVDPTSQALVVRLGQPVRVITDPGLNVKVPFIDSVIYIDKRILNIESLAQEVIASSQDNSNLGAQAGERLVVDAYARYRITDPLTMPQWRASDTARSSKTSSPPGQPISDSPTEAVGGGQPHNIMPPFIALFYCKKD